MLHNKLDKNAQDSTDSQLGIMKMVTDSGKLQMTQNMETKKLTERVGEMANDMTLLKGTVYVSKKNLFGCFYLDFVLRN